MASPSGFSAPVACAAPSPTQMVLTASHGLHPNCWQSNQITAFQKVTSTTPLPNADAMASSDHPLPGDGKGASLRCSRRCPRCSRMRSLKRCLSSGDMLSLRSRIFSLRNCRSSAGIRSQYSRIWLRICSRCSGDRVAQRTEAVVAWIASPGVPSSDATQSAIAPTEPDPSTHAQARASRERGMEQGCIQLQGYKGTGSIVPHSPPYRIAGERGFVTPCYVRVRLVIFRYSCRHEPTPRQDTDHR